MSIYRYAAYGSNLHPLRLARRTPSARLLGQAYRDDWVLRFHKKSDVDGSGKCGIVPGDGGVHFALYEIDLAEKPVLDAVEGAGVGYEDATISLPGFGDCRTYVAREEVIDPSLLPMDWYREIVLAGCAFNRFPDAYIAEIAATPFVADPDPVRSRDNWDLALRLTIGA